jgi:hypothetical protein
MCHNTGIKLLTGIGDAKDSLHQRACKNLVPKQVITVAIAFCCTSTPRAKFGDRIPYDGIISS